MLISPALLFTSLVIDLTPVYMSLVLMFTVPVLSTELQDRLQSILEVKTQTAVQLEVTQEALREAREEVRDPQVQRVAFTKTECCHFENHSYLPHSNFCDFYFLFIVYFITCFIEAFQTVLLVMVQRSFAYWDLNTASALSHLFFHLCVTCHVTHVVVQHREDCETVATLGFRESVQMLY